MADSDQALKILIQFIADTQGADAAADALNKLNAATTDANSEMGVIVVTADDVKKALADTGDKTDEAGKKTEESGHHSANARLKHMALHHAIAELNKVVPGLGSSMMMLSHGMDHAGDAAGGLGGKMSAAVTSVGPLIVVLLSIQAVTQYWELYKEKLKEVAAELSALSKQTQEDVATMVKAMGELDAAMHPKKKTLADADDDAMKAKLRSTENMVARQRELNRVEEEKEEKAAATPADKEKVKEKFALLDKELSDWAEKSKAAIEGATSATMDAQTKKLHDDASRLAKSPEERAAFQQAQGLDKFSIDTQKQIDEAKKSQAMSAVGTLGASLALPNAAAELEKTLKEHREEGTKKLHEIREKVEEKAKTASEIAEKRDPISEQAKVDTENAVDHVETNRQVAKARGQKYVEPPVAGFSHDSELAAYRQKLAEGQRHYQTLLKESQAAADQHNRNFIQLAEEARRQKEENKKIWQIISSGGFKNAQ